MSSRINNPEACICCSRRADGLAVGKPGKLAWYCIDCGADMAKIALAMNDRIFDGVEKRAADQVAKDAGNEPVTIQPDEMPDFIRWAVRSFAEQMRKDLEAGGSPF